MTTSNLIIVLVVVVGALLALNLVATSAFCSPVYSSTSLSDLNKQQDLNVKTSLSGEKQQSLYLAEDAQQQVSDDSLVSSNNNDETIANTDRSTDKLPENAQIQQDQQEQTIKFKATALRRQHRLNSPGAVEKLKRGLANFMNQLNPAPYFVPALAYQQRDNKQQSTSSIKTTTQQSSSSELAAIVNDRDSTPDALIKGRLALIRPIGGPMRWGHR